MTGNSINRIENYDDIVNVQNRCQECGKLSQLEVHHRIFKSELFDKTINTIKEYCNKHGILNAPDFDWGLNSAENLVVLCSQCHQNLHNHRKRERLGFRKGNDLNLIYKLSYTDKKTFQNIDLVFEKDFKLF